ncbi:MAG: phage portal protein [Clostridia bacterium]|nr:phage portal protein [Clostridia bacterium]
MKTFGRIVIYANYTENQLLKGSQDKRDAKVIDILSNSIDIHNQNRTEIEYLQDYLYGDQDIKNKVKLTRTDINNKGVENWAWAFQDWKKAFLLGKPIQYAPLDNVANQEISSLNKYVTFEDKDQKDQELYEDMFTVGRGYRYVNATAITEDDEAPFEILNFDVKNTEVVYSSGARHEQLLAFAETSKKYIVQEINPETNEKEWITKYYNEYTVYTRDMMYLIDDKNGSFRILKRTPIIHQTHLITEYYFNRKRMGLLEIGKDIFDDINYIENLDKDDIESFVNSIMVFTNAEVDKKGMDAIKEYGAVSIKSTDQKKASVELLQSRLKSIDTQIYYLRKISALHSILSVPQATSSGEMSNAETGKAMLTGQGFTSSSIRVENEEKSFKKCDRNSLKVILKICRNASASDIKNLKVSDIEIKFSRDLSDNLLVKTQALINLMTANIPPEIANAVINLFSDPVAVTKLQEEYIKKKQEIAQQIQNQQGNDGNEDEKKVKEQNNNMTKTTENQNQEQ